MNSGIDTSNLGTAGNPLRVAIIGSGPSGFYAAEALFKSPLTVRVDMLERLPVPFGLVRYGVAPDHPRLKQPTVVFDKIAQSPGFTFLGNVTVGRDVSLECCSPAGRSRTGVSGCPTRTSPAATPRPNSSVGITAIRTIAIDRST